MNPVAAFQTLRRLVPQADAAEHCGLCRQALAPQHDHLIDPRTRRLVCSCQACAILFNNPAAQYKRVPKQVRFLSDCDISDADWDALMIPIGIAFFVKQSTDGSDRCRRLLSKPGRAGGIACCLSKMCTRQSTGWSPDTQALLVNRAAREYFVLPIDECYRLVGLMRAHWKGLSGGSEVWREMQLFFAEMKGRAGVSSKHA